MLCSVILWIILPSIAVVQIPVHSKFLGLPSPLSLANVVLSHDDGKCPVSGLYSWFKGSKINNCEFHKSSNLNKMCQHSYCQYVALRGVSQLFFHILLPTLIFILPAKLACPSTGHAGCCETQSMYTQNSEFHCKMMKPPWFNHSQRRSNFLLLLSEQQISGLHVFWKALAHPRNYLSEANHENLYYSFVQMHSLQLW